MKQVIFLSSDGGIWGPLDITKTIPFRKLYQHARGLMVSLGKEIRIILKDGESEQDITEWVYRKAKE